MRQRMTVYMVLTGLFAALITIMTAYIFHIPIGVNGGYIHFGDALIYLAAGILPAPYAVACAAIGGGLADLLTAPAWLVFTVIIKSLLALLFRNTGEKLYTKKAWLSIVLAILVTAAGYYVAEGILYGSWQAALLSIPANIIQGAGSGLIFIVLALALDKVGLKKNMNI